MLGKFRESWCEVKKDGDGVWYRRKLKEDLSVQFLEAFC